MPPRSRRTRARGTPVEAPLAPQRRQAVLYARVSSKDQEREGFSIPAQQRLLHEYADREGFTIMEEFIDVETAKRTGRTHFVKMLAWLKRNQRSCRTILVEKTDRLYRNLKDWVTLDGLDLEIHFVKEGTVLADESRSSEKFMHGIRVLMAKNYIDNLSEEVRKGQGEKAQAGIWPTSAPIGYRNVTRDDGKRVIEPDPETEAIIRRVFELAATGEYSTAMLAKVAAEAGLLTPRAKRPPDKTAIYRILRNPIYAGEVHWRGQVYQGIHTPLVNRELWDKVQRGFDDRYQNQHETARRDLFAYAGLLTCGHCGCSLTAEIKKEKYVYYHCTGFRGKCGEPFVREEVLTEAFSQALEVIALPGPAMTWLIEALRKSQGDQQQFHAESIKRLEDECARIQRRLDAMYLDKLDGVIDIATYQRNAQAWSDELRVHRASIARHEGANRVYLEEGIMLLTLAQEARELFLEADAPTRRKLLGHLVSNCSWKDGKLTVQYRKPYDFLAEIHDQIDPSDPSGGTSDGGPLQTPDATVFELGGRAGAGDGSGGEGVEGGVMGRVRLGTAAGRSPHGA